MTLLKDLINETSLATTANFEAFIKDVAKAFGGEKGSTLDINITLNASNVVTYKITKK